MATSIYGQLVTDIQAYIKAQYKLLQVRSVEQTSELIGLIITIAIMTAIVVISMIFLAIALAAWLEQWLPMWASYLVIAGVMALVALGIYWGRRIWFVRPVEKHLSEVVMEDYAPLQKQKESLESQSAMQRELVERDVRTIQREWEQVKGVVEMIWRVFDGK
jgi:uncharacterized membrane protein